MTDRELQFHYFTMHDFDKNNMLDGLEIIKALTHSHDEYGKWLDIGYCGCVENYNPLGCVCLS